jgi:ribosome-associated protein
VSPSPVRAAFSYSTVFDPVYASLAGRHCVQRVPATEKNGRRHTSEVVVVVLTEQQGVGSVRVDRDEVRVDVYRDSGPGGQHRNKVETAVRLTHLPTGIVVTAADSRSQHENRRVAWQRLQAAVDARDTQRRHAERNAERAGEFTGGRSFTWTAWRDQVRADNGARVSMSKALAGRLGSLLTG